jgi:hypothetical protein
VKLELLNRVLTAAALVALAITLGVWLTRAPLTATPAATPAPVKTSPAKPSVPEPASAPVPTLAPLPLGPAAPVALSQTVTTEVEISYEIAPLPATSVVADPPPVAKPAETPPARPQSNCQQNTRRGWFRRR